jgi:hypothetical protein
MKHGTVKTLAPNFAMTRPRSRTLIGCVATRLVAATLPLAVSSATGVASAVDRYRSSGLSNSDLSLMRGAWRGAQRLSLHLRPAVNRVVYWPLGVQCGSTRWALAPAVTRWLRSHNIYFRQEVT